MPKPTPGEIRAWTQEFLNKMGPIICRVVEQSFISDGSRNVTKAMIKERIDWCWVMVKVLKLELRWSAPRIRDRLLDMLQRHLRGEEVDLMSEPSVWVPPVGDEFSGMAHGSDERAIIIP